MVDSLSLRLSDASRRGSSPLLDIINIKGYKWCFLK